MTSNNILTIQISSSQLRVNLDKCIWVLKSCEHLHEHKSFMITSAFASAKTTPVEKCPLSFVLYTLFSTEEFNDFAGIFLEK